MNVYLHMHHAWVPLPVYTVTLSRLQAFAKEEEICELQVKLRERDTLLVDYKRENARFAEIQQKYNSDIATLQQQVRTML